jgi:hypothetical protein
MRELKVVPRGTGGAVPNSRHVEQLEVVDLI